MKPYRNKKLTEYCDVGDIQSEARASHVGKLQNKNGEFKPYIRSAQKRKSIRRSLKRADKAKTTKDLQ